VKYPTYELVIVLHKLLSHNHKRTTFTAPYKIYKLCKTNSFIFDGAWMWEKYTQGFGSIYYTKEDVSLENLNLDGRITLVEMLKK
jgi:hypothetical protein